MNFKLVVKVLTLSLVLNNLSLAHTPACFAHETLPAFTAKNIVLAAGSALGLTLIARWIYRKVQLNLKSDTTHNKETEPENLLHDHSCCNHHHDEVKQSDTSCCAHDTQCCAHESSQDEDHDCNAHTEQHNGTETTHSGGCCHDHHENCQDDAPAQEDTSTSESSPSQDHMIYDTNTDNYWLVDYNI